MKAGRHINADKDDQVSPFPKLIVVVRRHSPSQTAACRATIAAAAGSA